MLQIEQEFGRLLQFSHEAEYRVQAFYGADLTLESVPVSTDGSLRFSADSTIQCTGSVSLADSSPVSLLPRNRTDPLAPYGQELRIVRVDKAASREWPTTMGQLRISDVPSMKEYSRAYPGKIQVVGASAELKLMDRFDILNEDQFIYPDGPKPGNSTYEEIQRISSVPVLFTESLPDRSVPPSLAYPDSRMDAITLLWANIGGYPAMTRFGQLTGRVKDSWLTATEPVFVILGVIDMDDSMSNKLSNSVRVKSSAGDNNLVAVREITDPGDPLSVTGPLRRRVYTQDSPLYETQSAVNAAADTILARVSTQQSRTAQVTCLPQPHLELGDYIRAVDTLTGKQVDGEISAFTVPLDPTASWMFELIVAETR